MKEISSQVRFNGHVLTDIIRVNVGFTIGLGTARENKLQTVGNSDGQVQLIDSRYDSKTISIPFTLPYESMGKKRELSAMLNVREPAQLWFSSEPDKYYMALPVSTNLAEEWDIGSGTLEFTCIDPFAHAMTPKTFDMVGDTITIENNGTMPTPVDFNITNHGENGYFGLVGENEIIQIGNPDEIDGYDYKKNEALLWNSFEKSGELDSWTMNAVKSSYYKPTTLAGSFGQKKGTHGDWCTFVQSYGEGKNKNMWYGPSMYRKFWADSFGKTEQENFRFRTVIGAADLKGSNFGVQSLDIVDKNKKMICGFYFRKLNWSTNDMELHFYVGDHDFQSWTGPSAWIMKNFLGSIVIEKQGNKFTFVVDNTTTRSQGTYTYIDETQGAMKGNGLVYWCGKAGGGLGAYNMQFFMTDVRSTVEGWINSKNMFADGDTIDVKVSDRGTGAIRTTVNYASAIDIQDLGSRPILAPVGKSIIKVTQSTFASPPTVKATIRERYL